MDFVDNQLDRGTGTIIGRAVAAEPRSDCSRPGCSRGCGCSGSGTYQALLIPDEAVGSDQAQKFVFVVDGENKAQYRHGEDRPAASTACASCARASRRRIGSSSRGMQRARPGRRRSTREERTIAPPADRRPAAGDGRGAARRLAR